MNIKLREEIEEAQQAKYALVQKECEKFRSLYYKVRREHETSRAEGEQQVSYLIFIIDC